ncbi:LysR substrate-binding domain-containing protein [Novosphingobium nitrogenifigens]|uniref:LysR substrate-binding domain-containing protein n=1 Tax=Novosphingobium nitrogenifigens TaxID=378548 RepID=UPI000AF3A48F|nr:LysR substrate-binding domain-containing protein [Novosphingobium nitrogenifigens]
MPIFRCPAVPPNPHPKGIPLARLPPLKALQAFEALGRLGSAVAAARELGVTPGAISQQIRRLEESTGIALTVRQGTGLGLTHAGRAYHGEIAEGFVRLHNAQALLDRTQERDVLIVSSLPSLVQRWIGPRLFEWADRDKGRLHLVSADAEPDLAQGEADFRVTYGQQVHAHAQWRELFTDRVVPACSPQLAATLPSMPSPADILALPLLGIEWQSSHGSAPGWADWAASLGHSLRHPVSVTFSQSSAAIGAAIDGHGVVLVQEAMMGDDLAKGRLVIAHDHRLSLPQPYYLAWPAGMGRDPFASAFRRWLIGIAPRRG